MRRSRKFEEELAIRKRPAAPVDEAAEEHGLADETLRLQELVGNTNTTSVIARSALQRDETATKADKKTGGEERGSGYTMTMSDVGTFELESLSWGQSKPIGRGEEGEGKVQYQDVTVSKKQDEHSSKLMQFAAQGKLIETVEIVINTSKGPMKYTLRQVYISAYQTGSGTPDEATESLTLTFGDMEYKLPEGSK